MSKIKIPANFYPSDKHLYDVIMSQNISPKKLNEFLVTKGIFTASKSVGYLADLICGLVYDQKEIEHLLSFTNIRENRIKTSSLEISAKDVAVADIHAMLLNLNLNSIEPDYKVFLDQAAKPTYDKDQDQTNLNQVFKRFDYSKTPLLQEENHQFYVTVNKGDGDKLKVTYSTSHAASEVYYKNIKDCIEAGIKEAQKTSYFHEITLDEIPILKVNGFFDELLKFAHPEFALDHLISITFFKGDQKANDQESTEEVSPDFGGEGETAEEQEDGAVIRGLKIDGKKLADHKDVIEYKEKGYSIKSVTGLFYSHTANSSRFYAQIQLGFNAYGKFSSELGKLWQVTDETTTKRPRLYPKAKEREMHLEPYNTEAFKIFDRLRKATSASSPTENAAPSPAEVSPADTETSQKK